MDRRQYYRTSSSFSYRIRGCHSSIGRLLSAIEDASSVDELSHYMLLICTTRNRIVPSPPCRSVMGERSAQNNRLKIRVMALLLPMALRREEIIESVEISGLTFHQKCGVFSCLIPPASRALSVALKRATSDFISLIDLPSKKAIHGRPPLLKAIGSQAIAVILNSS